MRRSMGLQIVPPPANSNTARAAVTGPFEYAGLVGQSAVMHELFATLRRLESSQLSVLLHGESGTGKELVSRAIHAQSSVSGGPFVALNCGALQRELIASELFGHRRGAFTGAIETRRGAFEQAHEGTLFLDEVAELPLELQPLLLRVLEEGTVCRVGETEERQVRVRVIAATHVCLDQAVAEGRFRADLYYRLNVLPVVVPPLRERARDVELLAKLFARRAGGPPLPQSVLKALEGHSWPGNVRELRNAVESYLVLGRLPNLAARPNRNLSGCLRQALQLDRAYHEVKEEMLEAFCDVYLERLMDRAGGNVSLAARLSGIERSYLNKLVRRRRISSA